MDNVPVFSMNTARICVDGFRPDISGRAYTKFRGVPLRFSGLGEFLLCLDELFDENGYPQSFQVRRSFRGKTKHTVKKSPESKLEKLEKLDDGEMHAQAGDCGTFDVVVQSRRCSSWQGILMDSGRTKVCGFRSELELIDGMCRAMTGS